MKKFLIGLLMIGSIGVAACPSFEEDLQFLLENKSLLGETETDLVSLFQVADDIKKDGLSSLSAEDALKVEKLISVIEKIKANHANLKANRSK